MTKLFETYELIYRLAALYQHKCYVCKQNCVSGKGFAIHHITYKKGEKTYRDFKKDRLAYYKYLFPIVSKDKKRFKLLCNKHHFAVGELERYNPDTRKRLYTLAKMGDKK